MNRAMPDVQTLKTAEGQQTWISENLLKVRAVLRMFLNFSNYHVIFKMQLSGRCWMLAPLSDKWLVIRALLRNRYDHVIPSDSVIGQIGGK